MTKRETRSIPGRGVTVTVLSAIALTCAVVGSALIFDGLNSASGSAPLPAETFDLDPETIPDPVTNGASQSRDHTVNDAALDNSLHIPAIDVHADLIPLDVGQDKGLKLPTSVNELAYWAGSTPITADNGSVLIAGHVDDANQGAGALYEMHTLQPGDAIYVNKDGITTRWKLVRLQSVAKDALPDWVFNGSTGPRQLHLVTCGGPVTIDTDGYGSYRDNVIATAVPF